MRELTPIDIVVIIYMILHAAPNPILPPRVVILGANGFLGSTLTNRLKSVGVPVLALTSSEVDLTEDNSVDKLIGLLKSDDSVVMLSAITPDKRRDNQAFIRNIKMAGHVCSALEKCPVAHSIYLSSDAVYSPELSEVSENTSTSPTDLYGTMHKARELMFQSVLPPQTLAILRLTLTYGIQDTHNSYGPNRFRRSAQQEKKIVLFGEGEETRDHIFIEDAVEVIFSVLTHRSYGFLNLATGQSHSFMTVAKKVAEQFDEPIEIICTSRKTPLTHRQYDIRNLSQAFPEIQFTSLEAGLNKVHVDMIKHKSESIK